MADQPPLDQKLVVHAQNAFEDHQKGHEGPPGDGGAAIQQNPEHKMNGAAARSRIEQLLSSAKVNLGSKWEAASDLVTKSPQYLEGGVLRAGRALFSVLEEHGLGGVARAARERPNLEGAGNVGSDHVQRFVPAEKDKAP